MRSDLQTPSNERVQRLDKIFKLHSPAESENKASQIFGTKNYSNSPKLKQLSSRKNIAGTVPSSPPITNIVFKGSSNQEIPIKFSNENSKHSTSGTRARNNKFFKHNRQNSTFYIITDKSQDDSKTEMHVRSSRVDEENSSQVRGQYSPPVT